MKFSPFSKRKIFLFLSTFTFITAVILSVATIGYSRPKTLAVQILGSNDFHGQITKGRYVAGRPVGSAPVLAAYLKAASEGRERETFIVHAGDFVGASPPESALLQDEPTIMFFNLMANKYCSTQYPMHPKCNIVGTVGNHELGASAKSTAGAAFSFFNGKGGLHRKPSSHNHHHF